MNHQVDEVALKVLLSLVAKEGELGNYWHLSERAYEIAQAFLEVKSRRKSGIL